MQEEKTLDRALKHIGLRLQKDRSRSMDFFTIEDKKKRQYDCYSNSLDWLDIRIFNVCILGKIKFFVCLFENEIENPFYGVNNVEELEVKLDLINA